MKKLNTLYCQLTRHKYRNAGETINLGAVFLIPPKISFKSQTTANISDSEEIAIGRNVTRLNL